MSFFVTDQNSQMNRKFKENYCSLLFQKILRNYKPEKKTINRTNTTPHSFAHSQTQLVKKQSEQRPAVVDLNRKMKLIRPKSQIYGENKENVNIYANVNFDQLTSRYTDKRNQIFSNVSQDSQASHQNNNLTLNFNELVFEQNHNESAQFANQNKKCLNQPLIAQNDNQNIYIQVNQDNKLNEQIISQQQALPDIIMPLKQPSKCSFMNQQKLCAFSVYEDNSQKIYQQTEKYMIQGKIKQERPQNIHHIKTKLSLRILNKKLKKSTIKQVVEDLISHRTIQLDEEYLNQDKKAICQALMSFIKNQLIK